MVPQQICFKKYNFKVALSKNTFSKLLSQSFSLKDTSSELVSQTIKSKFLKYSFKIACQKNTFSELLPQNIHFCNTSLKTLF